MAKKRAYKKVYKGKRYINAALKKYFTKRYPVGTDRNIRAAELFNEIKNSSTANEQKIILANIFRLERRSRTTPVAEPEALNDLSALLDYNFNGQIGNLGTPFHYFDLEKFTLLISSLNKNPKIIFTSELSLPTLPAVSSGGDMSYPEYFSGYVKHIDVQRNTNKINGGEDEYNEEYQVKCTYPILTKSGAYTTKIISCDISGNPENYGYNPLLDTQPPPTPRATPRELPTEPQLGSEPTPAQLSMQEKLNRAKELEIEAKKLEGLTAAQKFELQKLTQTQAFEIEKTRQSQISTFLKLFSEGKISKSEYKEFTNNL